MSSASDVLFAFLRSGLWEQGVRIGEFGPVDWGAVYRLADEQAVVGLVAAGLEHVEDVKVGKLDALPFFQEVVSLEGRNGAMNAFVAQTVEQMRAAGIRPLLVKGQGIAQCYERPLWRVSGDVDFLLDGADYERAKALLAPLASSVDVEGAETLHFGMELDGWKVELHGTMHCGLSSSVNATLDALQAACFSRGAVRRWQDGGTEILLPGADCDVLFVFTHFLKHFYKGGVCLRQVCDWARLLWTCRAELDAGLLPRRLRKMRLLSEWRAFGAFAVGHLGLPADALPLYDPAGKWARKAERIRAFVLSCGSERDFSYYDKYPFLVRKAISLRMRLGDLCRHARLFPLDSLRFLPYVLFSGLRSAVRGE